MRIQDGWTTAGRGPGWIGLVVALVLAAAPAMAWQGRVRSVPDGDSLTVERAGRTVKIRLYGIDSPEYRQPGWLEARDFTRRLVSGRSVEIEQMDRDNYGRVVALVVRDGVLVNRELVRAGHAWQYPRYCRSRDLCAEMASLQDAARAERLGLWREPSPLPPWKWKRLTKNRR